MKRTSILLVTALLLLVAGVQTAHGQKMKIYFTDSQEVKYDVAKIDRVEFEEALPVEEPEYVDLGLPSGTLWATCNIGASEPEEVGDYFSWGETETKDTYLWADYQYSDGSATSLTKYCSRANYGTVDGLKALEPADDAATVLFGDGWSIPTKEQVEELANASYTTWEQTEQNGVKGVRITSLTTDASIFLPIGGFKDNTSIYDGNSSGYFWTRNVHSSLDYTAWAFCYDSELDTENAKSRYCGLNIRAVYKESVEHGYVEIGGVKWATMNVGATTVAGSYKTCVGDHFAWGETEPRYSAIKWTSETEALVTWKNGFGNGYNNSPDYIGEELDAAHDAATANWGDEWRTPTLFEFYELAEACTDNLDANGYYTPIEPTTKIDEGGIYWLDKEQTIEPAYTGVAGMLFVSKDNISKRVFFPASGDSFETSFQDIGELGFYWSSTLYTKDNAYAYRLFLTKGLFYSSSTINRSYGFPVRPVKK